MDKHNTLNRKEEKIALHPVEENEKYNLKATTSKSITYLENEPVTNGISKKKKKKSKSKPSLESSSVYCKKNNFSTGMKHLKSNLFNYYKKKPKIIKEKEKNTSSNQYTNIDVGFKNVANFSPHNGTDNFNEFYVRKLENKRKSSAFPKRATNIDSSVGQECSRWEKKRRNCDSNKFHVAKKVKQENSFENVKTNLKVEQSKTRFVLEKKQDNELFFFDIAGNRGNSYVQSPILDKIDIETTTPGISNTKNINNTKKKEELRKKKHKNSAEEKSNSATVSSSFKAKLKKHHKHRDTFINEEEEVIRLSDSSCKDKKKKRDKTLKVTNHQGSCSKTNSFVDFSEDSSLLDRLIENFNKDINDVKHTIEVEEKEKPLAIKKEVVVSETSETNYKKKRKKKQLGGEILIDRDSDCEVTTSPMRKKKKKSKIYNTESEEMHTTKAFDTTLCENKSELEKDKSNNNSVATTNVSNCSSTKESSQLLDNDWEIVHVSDTFLPKKKKKKKKHAVTNSSVLEKEYSVSSESIVLLDTSHKITNRKSNSNLKYQKSELVHDIKDSDDEVSNVLFKKQKKKAMKLEHKTSETNTSQGEQSTLSQSRSLLDTLLEDWSNSNDVIEIEVSSSLKKRNSELSKNVDRDCEAVDASDLSKKKKHGENKSFDINMERNRNTSQSSNFLEDSLGNSNKGNFSDDSLVIVTNKDVKKSDREAMKKKKKKANKYDSTVIAIENTPEREGEISLESIYIVDSPTGKLNTKNEDTIGGTGDLSSLKKKKRRQENASNESTSESNGEMFESSSFLDQKADLSKRKDDNDDTQVIIDDTENADSETASVSDSSLFKKKKKKKKRQQESTPTESTSKCEHPKSNDLPEDHLHRNNKKDTQIITDDDNKAVCNGDSAFVKNKKKKKKKHPEDASVDTDLERASRNEAETSSESIVDISTRKLKQRNSELPKAVESTDYNAKTFVSLSKKKKKKKWKEDNYLADNESTPEKEDEILETGVDNLGRSGDENDEQNSKSCLDIEEGDCNAKSAGYSAFLKSKKNRGELGNVPSTSDQDISGCLYTQLPKNNDEIDIINNALEETSEKALKSNIKDEVSVDTANSESDLSNKKEKKRRDKTQFETTTEERTSLNCNNSLVDVEAGAIIQRNGLDNVKKSRSVLLKYDSESNTSKNGYYHEVYASSSEGYKSESSEIISPLKKLKKKRRNGDSSGEISKSDCDNTSEPFASIISADDGKNSSHLGVSQKMKGDDSTGSTEEDTTFKRKGRKSIEKASGARLANLEHDVKDESDDESSIIDGSKEDTGDLEKFLEIDIVLQFPIPPLHFILTRSTLPTQEQLKEIKNRKIEVKTGPFTKEEDQRILANWKKFCKEYDLRMVPSMFVTMPRKMATVQRNSFLRYLARGLDNRFLHRVHARFKILVEKDLKNSGRFTPEEDEMILFHINESSSKFPFRDLSELLNRSKLSIEKRYYRLNAENKNTINWTPELVNKLVKYMRRVTECEDVEELKHKKLTVKEWKRVSRKMDNIPVMKLQRAWNNTIYPRLFADSDVDLKRMKIKIIEMLDDMNETDWRKINWKEIAEEFPGFTNLKIYMMFRHLVHFHVPKEKHGNFKECVKFLRAKVVDNGVVPTSHPFRRFVYKDGCITCVRKRSESPTL